MKKAHPECTQSAPRVHPKGTEKEEEKNTNDGSRSAIVNLALNKTEKCTTRLCKHRKTTKSIPSASQCISDAFPKDLQCIFNATLKHPKAFFQSFLQSISKASKSIPKASQKHPKSIPKASLKHLKSITKASRMHHKIKF